MFRVVLNFNCHAEFISASIKTYHTDWKNLDCLQSKRLFWIFLMVGEPVEVHQPIFMQIYSVIVRTRRKPELSPDSCLKETATLREPENQQPPRLT